MIELNKLYNSPLPANRTGALYNAFAYPTKISPEAIALYIACHTKVGETVLDPFAGSGTTGLATMLCDQPTHEMIEMAKKLGVQPVWGKRQAVLYELSPLGAFISKVMSNLQSSKGFIKNAKQLINEIEKELESIYVVKDDEGKFGTLRYLVWSEVLICPKCKHKSSFWENAVSRIPLAISSTFKCSKCKHTNTFVNIQRVTETVTDPVLKKKHNRKKRIPIWIYGRTGKRTWNREANKNDLKIIREIPKKYILGEVPVHPINWGVLHRKGYHKGITHLHHFYTDRNLIVFSRLWEKINDYPVDQHDVLKLLLLSYNTSHSTLMSRVVVKKQSTDFVITGAQSGVLYISNLPAEKNIFEGLKRKITTLSKAFDLVSKSKSTVTVFNESSTSLGLDNQFVSYVFTDPPFGDYIPYSEINQINEAWLGQITNSDEEVVVNSAQNKSTDDYARLMTKVFLEVNRVLRNKGRMNLVFHSAKAEIWQALVSSYQNAGFKVVLSNILDKVQGSFKQVTSTIKVQGDPLLLLTKSNTIKNGKSINDHTKENRIIKNIIQEAFNHSNNADEQKPERLFSRYVTACLESGVPISTNASKFYKTVEDMIKHHQNVS
jgi:DNA modification methylase